MGRFKPRSSGRDRQPRQDRFRIDDRVVSQAEILREFGEPPAGLELPGWIHEWRETNGLPGARRPAPHAWA